MRMKMKWISVRDIKNLTTTHYFDQYDTETSKKVHYEFEEEYFVLEQKNGLEIRACLPLDDIWSKLRFCGTQFMDPEDGKYPYLRKYFCKKHYEETKESGKEVSCIQSVDN